MLPVSVSPSVEDTPVSGVIARLVGAAGPLVWRTQVSDAEPPAPLPVATLPNRSVTPVVLTVNVYVPSIGTTRLLKFEIANSVLFVPATGVMVIALVMRFDPPFLV